MRDARRLGTGTHAGSGLINLPCPFALCNWRAGSIFHINTHTCANARKHAPHARITNAKHTRTPTHTHHHSPPESKIVHGPDHALSHVEVTAAAVSSFSPARGGTLGGATAETIGTCGAGMYMNVLAAPVT